MDNYFRCPWCGSSVISTETQKEGYDIKKGLIGTALFGTGGAVMGINMNEKKYNYCQMCRKTFTQCMPVSTIKDIERLLRDSNMDHPLLKMYKNHYPNFEMDNIINTNNNSSVNIEELSDEELANKIYKYCRENFVTRQSKEELFKIIGDSYIKNVNKAIEILEKRGLAKQVIKENKLLYYDFFLDEEKIKDEKEKILIRNGEMDTEELANKMYQYCKENNISYINGGSLEEAIADGCIENGLDALNILEERGWAKCDFNASDWCYNFFLTEKEIEKNAIREEKLDNETLANIIYQYCKDNNISNIDITTLSKEIADSDKKLVVLYDALDILEEQGLAEYDVEKSKSTDKSWYNFKIDNLENTSDRTNNRLEDKNIEDVKKYKELLDSGIITQEEFDKKKKELLNL